MDRSFVVRAPENLTALTDLQWTLNKISDFVRQRLGDRTAARTYIDEMIGIDRRLVNLQRTSKDRHTRLKDDLAKLANLLIELNDQAAARATYIEVFAVTQRWLEVTRGNYKTLSSDANRSELVQALGDAGWNALLAGRAADGIPLIQESLSMSPDTPWNTVNLAHAYLFQGRYAEALKLYSSVKDLSRSQDGKRTYANEIKDDFGLFRRLGLTRSEIDRAERELKL
jgi:tetratricopeptide (TPR) repeat protein